MSFELFVSIALAIVAPAVLVSTAAFLCAKRRALTSYVMGISILVVLVAAVGGWASRIARWEPDAFTYSQDVVGAFMTYTPMFAIPAIFLVNAVRRSAPWHRMFFLAIAGSAIAAPIAFFTSLTVSCKLGHGCV